MVTSYEISGFLHGNDYREYHISLVPQSFLVLVFYLYKKSQLLGYIMGNIKILLGLSGKAGSGKSEVAKYLVNKYYFTEIKFAGPLKEDLSKMLEIPMSIIDPETLENRKIRDTKIIEPWGMTIREMLQKIGTDCFRKNFHEKFWIIRLDKLIKKRFYGKRLVISDVRFRNEIDYVIESGGHIFKVLRNAWPGMNPDEHQSEMDLDEYDYPCFILENYTTFERLYERIDILIRQLKKPEKEFQKPWEITN